jgi:hypothetical protein
MGAKGDSINDNVVKHSLKRVMKTIDNFILTEYQSLFEAVAVDIEDSKKAHVCKVKAVDVYQNQKLLQKAREELKWCDDQNMTPTELIKICIQELESLGFINTVQEEADIHMFEIRDQRDKLKQFIGTMLKEQQKNVKEQQKGMNFNDIYRQVAQAFNKFYTKDVVFKVIDELFQMGLIYEVSKCTYAYLDNQF